MINFNLYFLHFGQITLIATDCINSKNKKTRETEIYHSILGLRINERPKENTLQIYIKEEMKAEINLDIVKKDLFFTTPVLYNDPSEVRLGLIEITHFGDLVRE